MPVIEPGLPYMDGRAMAYLLKDIAHRDKVDRAVEIFEWLRRQTGQYSQLCDVYVYTTGDNLVATQAIFLRQDNGHLTRQLSPTPPLACMLKVFLQSLKPEPQYSVARICS